MKRIILIIALSLGVTGLAKTQGIGEKTSTKKERSCFLKKKNKKDANETNQQSVLGNEISETFMVHGNCGMCKNTIEKAANSVSGVKSAVWDQDSDMVTVIFNKSETSLKEINQAIADSGYDTLSHRTTDSVYNKLPGCCKYDRPEKKFKK